MKDVINNPDFEKSGINSWMIFSNLLVVLLLFAVIFFAVYSPLADKDTAETIPDIDESLIDDDIEKQLKVLLDKANVKSAELQNDLNDLSASINEIVNIKGKIALELKELTEELNIDAVVDLEAGTIRFNDYLTFESNSYTISNADREMLDKFMPAFFKLVLSEEYRQFIDYIGIQGHADDGGIFIYNLNLSYNRAYSAAEYILSMDIDVTTGIDGAEEYIKAVGFSSSTPVYTNGKIDKVRTRRVEFAFEMKDYEIFKRISTELAGDTE